MWAKLLRENEKLVKYSYEILVVNWGEKYNGK